MAFVIKRVPLSFNHPIGKVWEGFVNSNRFQQCPKCQGTTYSLEAKRIYDQWYGQAKFSPEETGSKHFTICDKSVWELSKNKVIRSEKWNTEVIEQEQLEEGYEWVKALYVKCGNTTFKPTDNSKFTVKLLLLIQDIVNEANRLVEIWNRQWCHHLAQEDVNALIAKGRLHHFVKELQRTPTAEEVNEWSVRDLLNGHDSINHYYCVEAKCNRLGIPIKCSYCKGKGIVWDSVELEALHENWQPTEPPVGDGYQVWEVLTEGSPLSPVFEFSEQVVDWLVLQKRYSRQEAEKFVQAEWLPTKIVEIN